MHLRVPRPPLDAHIELFWHYPGEPLPAHRHERVLPNGTVTILFPIPEAPIGIYDSTTLAPTAAARGALISGPQVSSFAIDTTLRTSIIGVHFKPGGASAVLGVPLHVLLGKHVALEDVWGSFAADLLDQVRSTRDPVERLARLERGVVARTRGAPGPGTIPGAVLYGLNAFRANVESARIDDVARDIGLSTRRLSQLFRDWVGMPPKRYARLLRLQSALAMAAPEVGWGRVAHACGYFDQSHFINEFHAITGTHPHRYFAERTAETNHLILAG
ncbi:helix-turn-helix domain-containing protein [Pendulispora albinea]|uniref:Helix-turn-helix transcriptional regulator n=1 Tax=Pendulispora albinea TaxID=2741071 RepID=A0ABZ2LYR7_9BACT